MLASDILGRTAHDHDGRPLGRITDLIAYRDHTGHTHVTAVLVSRRLRARLFGYERPGLQRPWVLEKLVRLAHRGTTEIPVDEIRWPPTETGK
ncbi:PRC-barrel domain containing protein [Actinocrispum sp. NPDC049592]|uniref:PRC-barrel domain containing protein n=1 Tax=Actinocrispum sp. NPDC049592 TaxID=3154835 RepID=UPI00342D14E4